MELTETDIKKELYKTKAMANFSHLENGKAYYQIMLDGSMYQFPLALEEEKTLKIMIDDEVVSTTKIMVPTSDMKGASFGICVRGSELNRWIAKAIKSENLIKIQ